MLIRTPGRASSWLGMVGWASSVVESMEEDLLACRYSFGLSGQLTASPNVSRLVLAVGVSPLS